MEGKEEGKKDEKRGEEQSKEGDRERKEGRIMAEKKGERIVKKGSQLHRRVCLCPCVCVSRQPQEIRTCVSCLQDDGQNE